VRERGLQTAVTVGVADLRADLPAEPASCDAIWTADVLYPDTVGDPASVVAAFSRALKPGGILAIFSSNWLRPVYLPGYARLEHLICAAREARYAREPPWQGTAHPERPLAWLAKAGFTSPRLELFPVLHRPPLPATVRRYIATAILDGHDANAVAAWCEEDGMTAADEQLWRRLSDPQSPDYILEQPDYFCAATPLLALGQRLA
jgi:SAM-dependent methyltransferase